MLYIHCLIICYQECDLGYNSILNAVKLKVLSKREEAKPSVKKQTKSSPFSKDKPLCETLLDLQLTEEEKRLLQNSSGIAD